MRTDSPLCAINHESHAHSSILSSFKKVLRIPNKCSYQRLKVKRECTRFWKKRGCQSLLSLYKTQPIFKAYFKGKKVSHILENTVVMR